MKREGNWREEWKKYEEKKVYLIMIIKINIVIIIIIIIINIIIIIIIIIKTEREGLLRSYRKYNWSTRTPTAYCQGK